MFTKEEIAGIAEAIRNNHKISAIRVWRDATADDLYQSKAAIDRYIPVDAITKFGWTDKDFRAASEKFIHDYRPKPKVRKPTKQAFIKWFETGKELGYFDKMQEIHDIAGRMC